MKKTIMIVSIALIGIILAVTGNSWAASHGGGQYPKWDKPSNSVDRPDRGRSLAPGIKPDRPVNRLIPQIHKPYHNRAPYRFAPKYRPWRHRPFYRPFRPGWNYRQHHRGAVMNNFYSSSESYAPEDEFSASATISDTGFSVSVGVRDTN